MVAKLINIRLLHIYFHIFHFRIYSSHTIKINNVYLLINLPRTMKYEMGWLVDNFSVPPIQIRFSFFFLI
ncbi:hypothetical protein F383_20730 [Gossypium arboreum]|uniref:Uncharacterized protein n=1 Tax=Gossypium arboreum TaxID=29729 RepID=A0A0B0NT71_GOSAR|nr:hypothetical protein F383_20730 [Gossypium arboreum]